MEPGFDNVNTYDIKEPISGRKGQVRRLREGMRDQRRLMYTE